MNQEILYTLKLNRLYWKDSWNVFKQKGAFKSNPNHKKLEFQSSGPSKTVISRNSAEIRRKEEEKAEKKKKKKKQKKKENNEKICNFFMYT